jgi:hypothetical protein
MPRHVPFVVQWYWNHLTMSDVRPPRKVELVFFKKTRATPTDYLTLARKRQKELEQ